MQHFTSGRHRLLLPSRCNCCSPADVIATPPRQVQLLLTGPGLQKQGPELRGSVVRWQQLLAALAGGKYLNAIPSQRCPSLLNYLVDRHIFPYLPQQSTTNNQRQTQCAYFYSLPPIPTILSSSFQTEMWVSLPVFGSEDRGTPILREFRVASLFERADMTRDARRNSYTDQPSELLFGIRRMRTYSLGETLQGLRRVGHMKSRRASVQ